jgi:hypothetical protein
MVQALIEPTGYKYAAGSLHPAAKGALPSLIVIPTTTSVLPCSGLSRCGLAMMGARGNVGATANLDSPCARQRLGFVGRGEETGSRSNKETDEEKDELLRRGLTRKAPYKVCSWPAPRC